MLGPIPPQLKQDLKISLSVLFFVYGGLLICEGCFVADYRAREKGEATTALVVSTQQLMDHADKVLPEDKAAMIFVEKVLKPFNVVACRMEPARWAAIAKWLFTLLAGLVAVSSVLCWNNRDAAALKCDMTSTRTANTTNATDIACVIHGMVQETAYCCHVVPTSFLSLIQAASSTTLALWAVVKTASGFILAFESASHKFGDVSVDRIPDVSEVHDANLQLCREFESMKTQLDLLSRRPPHTNSGDSTS